MTGALVALAEELQQRCRDRGLTLALAESCTGGLVAATVTEVAGSSDYFLGGVVSYSNAAKETLLGVPASTLAAHGAVSAEVAMAMAHGAKTRFGADLAAAITGVAGPGGGTPQKPVGLVYLAVAAGAKAGGDAGIDAGAADVRRLQLTGDRAAVREAAAQATLEWLIEAAGTVAR